MKERRIGEYAVETALRQIELEEILLPHFAAAGGACHGDEGGRALQPDRSVSAGGERLEVTSRSATEIEDRKGCEAFDVAQQRFNVLAHIVVTRTRAKFLRSVLVIGKCARGDLLELLRIERRGGVVGRVHGYVIR